MKKKMKSPRMTIHIEYVDGSSSDFVSDAKYVRELFSTIVGSLCIYHSTQVKNVQLLDSANRVYKFYIQMY